MGTHEPRPIGEPIREALGDLYFVQAHINRLIEEVSRLPEAKGDDAMAKTQQAITLASDIAGTSGTAYLKLREVRDAIDFLNRQRS